MFGMGNVYSDPSPNSCYLSILSSWLNVDLTIPQSDNVHVVSDNEPFQHLTHQVGHGYIVGKDDGYLEFYGAREDYQFPALPEVR